MRYCEFLRHFQNSYSIAKQCLCIYEYVSKSNKCVYLNKVIFKIALVWYEDTFNIVYYHLRHISAGFCILGI